MEQNGHNLTFRMLWNIYILFILCVAAGIVSTEPCDEYTIISDNERAANLQLNLNTTNPFTDDRLTDGWYRVQNDVGEEMATSPPGTFNCTTWSPIWLNGSLPSTINTTVTKTVCIQTFQSTCKYTWDIEIKRCPGNYLVYKLKPSPLIDSGYCFGWAVPCPAGQTGWSPNCKNATTTSSTTISLTTTSSTTASMTKVNSTTVTTRSTGNGLTTDGSVRGGEQKEPCDVYTVISDNERAANLELNLNVTTTYPFTDDRLTDGWYRVQNDVGEEMATNPPGALKCTTWSPIWLNGSLPSTINTTVTIPVCIQTFQFNCKYTWDIEIKRCPGNYLVYKLKTSPLTDSGYCFGWAVPCPAGQTGWSPNCKNATMTSSTTVSSTTASSTMVSSTTGRGRGNARTTDGSVRGGEQKGKEEEETNVVAIVCAIFAVICVFLLLGIVVVRNKMTQKRCNTEESKKNLYQEITKEYKYNKENDHIYSVPGWGIYQDDSPPPYSSRRPSACSDVLNSNGWTVEPQSPPVYLFTVGKK